MISLEMLHWERASSRFEGESRGFPQGLAGSLGFLSGCDVDLMVPLLLPQESHPPRSRPTRSTRGVQAGSSAPLSWARPPRKKPTPPVSGARALVCQMEAKGAGRRLLPRARERRGRPRPVPRSLGGASGARLGCMQVARRSAHCSSAGAALTSPRQWAWGRRPGTLRPYPQGPPTPTPGSPRLPAAKAGRSGPRARPSSPAGGGQVGHGPPAGGGCWSRARLCFGSQFYSGSWSRN